MKVLVLGASGYVGSRIVPALVEAGHEVVAASSSVPAPERFAWGSQVEWARCDVRDTGFPQSQPRLPPRGAAI